MWLLVLIFWKKSECAALSSKISQLGKTIIINPIVFQWKEVYVLVNTTYSKFRNFPSTKNKLITKQTYVHDSYLRILEGRRANISSIKIVVLQLSRIGHWISCFNPCTIQNSWYFLASADTNFVRTVLFWLTN